MNWYALLLCIVAEYEVLSAEDAFDSLEQLRTVRTRTNKYISENESFLITKENSREISRKMVELRKGGMTYKQIGKLFGINSSSVYSRIRSVDGKRKKIASA